MKWSKWMNVEDVTAGRSNELSAYGIYQLRAVGATGRAIPLPRLVGVDRDGILYVGRSGFRRRSQGRTVAKRIREFVKKQHSGGKCYARAKRILDGDPRFREHRLQVRGSFLGDDLIERGEARALQEYFDLHAELPPCNSQRA